MLEKSLEIAIKAHKGQKDRAGKPYITHPLRVMMKMHNETEMIVAILHDIVEDTEFTLDKIIEIGYPEEIINAIDSITKRENEEYTKYIERCSKNRLASVVKLSDLEDNMDITRSMELTDKDHERLNKYLKAWYYIKKELEK